MKIPLERTKMPEWKNPKFVEFHIKSAEPFLRNKKAILIHRVRSAFITGREDRKQHMAVHSHCGQGVCGDGDKLDFVACPGEMEVVCQRCEDMAIERGLPSSSELAGRHVHTGGVKPYMNCCKGFEK